MQPNYNAEFATKNVAGTHSSNGNGRITDGKVILPWLAEQGAAFCLVRSQGREPFQNNWADRPHELAEALRQYTKNHLNIGLLCGRHSDNLGLLDLDDRYREFCKQFPELATAPTVIRNDPNRAKILIRIKGEMPRPRKFKKGRSDKPFMEWLAQGNQGVICGRRDDGIRYGWLNMDSPIPELTPDELIEILEKWTGEKFEPQPTAAPTLPQIYQAGERNNSLLSLAGTMQRRGASPDAILEALLAENRAKCDPPLDDEEVAGIASGVQRYPPAPKSYHYSDWGNAERFVAEHADEARYDHSGERWLLWDGQRWAPDRNDAIDLLAIQTVNNMHAEVQRMRITDESREVLAKWAAKCEARYRRVNFLKDAQSIPPIAINADDLNQSGWQFNCLNGTIDLTTGELLPHDPTDMITKLAPVNYDPDATSEVWQRCLDVWTEGDKEMQHFLQLAVGYSLTGDVREKTFFFVHGPKDGGKTTFLEVIAHILGDYAETAPFEAFLKKSGPAATSNGPRPELVALRGMRFVKSSEVGDHTKFDSGLLKQLTGGDSMRIRDMYEKGETFTPIMKLWLAANEVPYARFDDDPLWRRLVVVPFDKTIPREEQIPNLKEELIQPDTHGAAILVWAVQGCLEWQRTGLVLPERIAKKNEDVKDSMDMLADFFTECIAPGGEKDSVGQHALYERYRAWARLNAIRVPMTGNMFTRELGKRGYVVKKRKVAGKMIMHVFGVANIVADGPAMLSTTRETTREERELRRK